MVSGWHQIKQRGYAVALSLVVLASVWCTTTTTPSYAMDVLRQVPLNVTTVEAAKTWPEQFLTSESAMTVVEENRNLLLHMEAIRRANTQLSDVEKTKLLKALLERHQDLDEDAVRYFDLGYAQLVFEDNKTGLFYLRKANDALKNEFTALAYAMAQAEIDLNHEGSTPETMTTRKMSVVYNLKDALDRNHRTMKPGFWPSFVSVAQVLKVVPSYNEFLSNDLTSDFVAYGTLPPPDTEPLAAALEQATGIGCDEAHPFNLNKTAAVIKRVDFEGQGRPSWVTFTSVDPMHPEAGYHVVVNDRYGCEQLSFDTKVGPYIVEDLDGDGTYEIVIRQFQEDPLNPILVYRLQQDGTFKPDTDIEAFFK